MIQLTSPAFADGETIPERFACDGDGLQEDSLAEDVRAAVNGLTVAEGKLTGRYGRS